MSEQAYRQRLEADLLRWQTGGVITPSVRDAIRGTFGPLPRGIDIATVVAIVGGLLIAAAFLAFVAANWTAIDRPLRLLLLLTGIVASHAIGVIFARLERPYLADLSVAVGAIIFGASVALVGQMYHLAADFAGGMALISIGALVSAVLTGSRGALAVALAAGVMWNHMRVEEFREVQLYFLAVLGVGAILAVAWNAVVARHLVALAILAWWGSLALELRPFDSPLMLAAGASLLLGGGLVLASRAAQPLADFGLTLSTYGAFALAFTVALTVADALRLPPDAPIWAKACLFLGPVLALAAAAMGRRYGPVLAALSIALGTLAIANWVPFHPFQLIGTRTQPTPGTEPWLSYALALAAMLCLVVSGMIDNVRSRVVAGWVGLACVIAAITWAVKGSLLRRAVFLAIAGASAAGAAFLLARLRKEEPTA